jgi:hypothetical protein
MGDVKVHLSETQLRALDAQFALALGAFLDGLSDEAPEPGDYGIDAEREAHYWDVLLADGEAA